MAYTTIDNPELYFQTKLYAGNGSNGHAITFDGSENMQPDWVWIKSRSSNSHRLTDSVRGATKVLYSDLNFAEVTDADTIQSFDTDGFTIDDDTDTNGGTQNFASWNWKAGGSAPAITYSVKVVSDSGNKYRFDDFGTSAVTLDLQEGGTYTFDQSDSSNSGHPLRFSTTSDGSHGGGSEYTTGVTTTGTPGSSGAKTVITVSASAPTLYYYCTQHSGMGGQANTNLTFGSSNFSGSVQSVASANTTAGFSIVSYTGTGSATTVGHGLGSTPKIIFVKNRDAAQNWLIYSSALTGTSYLRLNLTNAKGTVSAVWNNTDPTSSVFTVGTDGAVNASSQNLIAYCFAEKKGYSKFGSYTGNGNADGTFVYTGFRVSWIMSKRTDATDGWRIRDAKRDIDNPAQHRLLANTHDAEVVASSQDTDFLSNGFKIRNSDSGYNTSGATYIYMAFAESPFVNSNGVPNNAR